MLRSTEDQNITIIKTRQIIKLCKVVIFTIILFAGFDYIVFMDCSDLYSSELNSDQSTAWNKSIDKFDEEFSKIMVDSDSKWNEYKAKHEKAWNKYKKKVEDKWDGFVTSTKKELVDYSEDKNSRSRINFEKGCIEIEVVVPADDPKAAEAAKKKIARQTSKVFSDNNIIGENLLQGQVKDKSGKIVSKKNANEFIKNEVIPEIKLEKKEFRAKDGIARIKYKAKIQMVPEHLRIRAKRYLPMVKKNAKRFSVNPQLILAIIHTESCFNPMAVSHCGAIGLMQIIPRYAGSDAYKYIYNKEKILASAYLYKPENNIELGAAYLHLLKRKHFSSIPKNPKNRYLTVCGYNWGPGAMRNKILKRYNVGNMSDADLFGLLRKKTPKETSDYLKRVTERMPLYANFFN
ncbi:MAG: murein transglycosylase domain-containing protein [Chloroflexota bacterium]|nr:murein transglycosylase domain-containing protein [Chloroflexota bacterium]